MHLEQHLLHTLSAIPEHQREATQKTILSLLTDEDTPRLNLDTICTRYNQLCAGKPWTALEEVAPNCTPLGPGTWTEWTDDALNLERVGCALIVLADRPSMDMVGAEMLPEARWLVQPFIVLRGPDAESTVSVAGLLIGVMPDGKPLPHAAVVSDMDEFSDAMRDLVVNLMATALMGVSCVHTGIAELPEEGRRRDA